MAASSAIRRRLRLACIALGVSIISVISVAWGSALFLDYNSSVDQWQSAGLSKSEWWHLSSNSVFGGVRYTSTVMIRALEYKETGEPMAVPAWATMPPPPTLDKWPNDFYEIVEGRGWPWPCVSYRFSGKGGAVARSGDVTGGFALSPFKTGGWYSPRVLPYTPVWGGLAADLGVHFAIWFGALMLFVEGRRALRRRRNRCSNCGYLLIGADHAACPECGEAVPTARAT